jgi:hypothetical protein
MGWCAKCHCRVCKCEIIYDEIGMRLQNTGSMGKKKLKMGRASKRLAKFWQLLNLSGNQLTGLYDSNLWERSRIPTNTFGYSNSFLMNLNLYDILADSPFGQDSFGTPVNNPLSETSVDQDQNELEDEPLKKTQRRKKFSFDAGPEEEPQPQPWQMNNLTFMCEKKPPVKIDSERTTKRLKKLSCSKNDENEIGRQDSGGQSHDSLQDFIAADDTISNEDSGLESAISDSDIEPVLGVKRGRPFTRNQHVVSTEYNFDDDQCITQTYSFQDPFSAQTTCVQPTITRPFYKDFNGSGREYSRKSYAAKLNLKEVTGENLFDHKPKIAKNPRKPRKK